MSWLAYREMALSKPEHDISRWGSSSVRSAGFPGPDYRMISWLRASEQSLWPHRSERFLGCGRYTGAPKHRSTLATVPGHILSTQKANLAHCDNEH